MAFLLKNRKSCHWMTGCTSGQVKGRICAGTNDIREAWRTSRGMVILGKISAEKQTWKTDSGSLSFRTFTACTTRSPHKYLKSSLHSVFYLSLIALLKGCSLRCYKHSSNFQSNLIIIQFKLIWFCASFVPCKITLFYPQ